MNPKKLEGQKKPCAHFVPLEVILEEAKVMQSGAEEYGRFNWRLQNVDASTYISAIFRHYVAWAGGENLDSKSGISHLAHIRASCAILFDAQRRGELIDDRLKAEVKSKEPLPFPCTYNEALPTWYPLLEPIAEPAPDPCPPTADFI